MAGVPKNFEAISNVLANYNYVDLAAGTGIILFYAGKTADLSLLSNNEFYSEPIFTTSGSFSEVASTKRIDLDFDVQLNRPLVIKGIVVLNVPIRIYVSQDTTQVIVTARVRKWDGVTETEICTNDSSASLRTGAGTSYFMKAIDLTIPLTTFKIGETLRLTIELWSSRSGVAGNADCGVAFDPMNRVTDWDTTGTVPSKLVFQCPVMLNL